MPLDQLEQMVLAKAAAVGQAAEAQAMPAEPMAAEPMMPAPEGVQPSMGEMPPELSMDDLVGQAAAGLPEVEAPPEVVQAATAALVAAGLLQAPSSMVTAEVLDALQAWNEANGNNYNLATNEGVLALLEDLNG